MDSWIKFKIEELDLDEVRYNGKFNDIKELEKLLQKEPRRTVINFKNGDKIIILGSKAREYFAKTQDIRREL